MTLHEKKLSQIKILEENLTDREAYKYLAEYGREKAISYIAGKFNVTKSAVNCYLNNHNIHQPSDISQQKRLSTNQEKYGAGTKLRKPVIDKDLLQLYYVDEMIDIQDIIPLFDNKYTKTQIRNALSEYGIKRPPKGNPNRKRTKEAIEKGKQTCLDRYGEENPNQVKEFKEKAVQTCLDRYGVEHILQVEEVQQKKRATTLEHYGVENPFMVEEIQQKARDTQVRKYGKPYTMTEEFVQKVKESKESRYGNPNYNNIEQIKQTKVERYGDPNYRDTDKTMQTCMEKYGVPYISQSPEIRSKQAKSAARSGLEGRVEELLKNNSIDYSRQYTISLDGMTHAFDFAIYKDENLEMLVDCDGLYYHEYLADRNGKQINNYTDEYRSMLVPEGIKFLVILEGQEEDGYKELLRLYDIEYEEYLNAVFSWCREMEFPYPSCDNAALTRSFNSLKKYDPMKFTPNARTGMKIVDAFHPSIWHANKRGHLSPYRAWQDDELLKKCIRNRVIYKGCDLDRSKVLTGFSVSGIAPKVSVFNPYLAKYIIYKYLNEFDTIFDPCSGYSGRLLGAVALGKNYIGQDVNPVTIEESSNLINYFGFTGAKVSCKNLLEDSGTYDCLFTCPPYSDKENWDMPCENKACDGWINECLNRYKCRRYVFVVDGSVKYKDHIVEEIKSSSHFNRTTEYIVVLDSTK